MAFPVEIGLAIALFLVVVLMQSDGRELRPSDHGLVYQDSQPASAKSPAEVKSFFVGVGGGEKSSPAADTALPKAMNSSDSSWWNGVVARGGGRRDHVKDVLLVASLLCGITGVALLVATAFVYILRYRKHKSLPSSPDSPPQSPSS